MKFFYENTFETVHSFKPIQKKIKDNTLVICDIDDTLLYFTDIKKNMFEKFIKLFPYIENKEENFEKMYSKNFVNDKAKSTDIKGFKKLTELLLENKGNLIFLTSRHEDTHYCLKQQFLDIGLNSSFFSVYYTNNTMDKGTFIKNHINYTFYKKCLFIDNELFNVNDVIEKCPSIECILFEHL